MCVWVRAYMRAYMRAYVRACMYVCACAHVCVCACVSECACARERVHMCVWGCLCAYMCTCVCVLYSLSFHRSLFSGVGSSKASCELTDCVYVSCDIVCVSCANSLWHTAWLHIMHCKAIMHVMVVVLWTWSILQPCVINYTYPYIHTVSYICM